MSGSYAAVKKVITRSLTRIDFGQVHAISRGLVI